MDVFERIKVYLDELEGECIKRCFLEIVSGAKRGNQEAMLEVVEKYVQGSQRGAELVVYKPRISDSLVTEKMAEFLLWFGEVDERAVWLEADGYEDYSKGWGDDWTWEYEDNQGIGAKVERAFLFAKDCVNDRKYESALQILEWLIRMEVDVRSDYNDDDEMSLEIDDLVDEGLVKVDLKEMALLTLYSAYQIAGVSERAGNLYAYFTNPFTERLFIDVPVEDIMRRVGREYLKDEAVFWQDWIALLAGKSGDLEARLLRKALLFSRGAGGLADEARRSGKMHPALFLDALIEYKVSRDYHKMVDLGEEAVASLAQNLPIRSKIALKTASAHYELGQDEEMKRLWYEAYLSNQSEVNYLRLFITDELMKQYGMMAKDSLKNVSVPTLQFLAGEFDKVRQACVNPPNSLGWSGNFIGTGIRLFLLYLYSEDELDAASKSLAGDIAYEFRFKFKTNEEFTYLEKEAFIDISDGTAVWWYAFKKWRQHFPMSEMDKQNILLWLEEIIAQRVTAIVDGQFRRHYESVAQLLATLGSVKEFQGQIDAKQELKESFKQKFPRHSSFTAELNKYF